jgi:hypothetical protein
MRVIIIKKPILENSIERGLNCLHQQSLNDVTIVNYSSVC